VQKQKQVQVQVQKKRNSNDMETKKPGSDPKKEDETQLHPNDAYSGAGEIASDTSSESRKPASRDERSKKRPNAD